MEDSPLKPIVPQASPGRSPAGRGGLSSLRRLPRNVWAVTVASGLTDLSTDTLTGLLPFYLAQTLGASTAAIGLIEGVADATASLVKLGSGWFSDRWRRRKPLAVFGYGLSTASKALMLVATTWPRVLVVRFFERSGKGIRTAPRDALLADSIAVDQRGFAFGVHRAGDTAGAVLGLSIGWLIATTLGEGASLTLGAFRVAVVLSLIPAILAVIVLGVFAREIRPAGAAQQEAKGGNHPARQYPRFRWFLASVVIFTLGNSSDAFLLLRAQNLGLSISGAIGTLIALNLVYTALSPALGALSDRLGRRKVLLAGWLIYVAVYIALAVADESWQLWPIVAAYGVYYAATEGVGKAFVADLVPSPQRGTAYGMYHAAIGAGCLMFIAAACSPRRNAHGHPPQLRSSAQARCR